MEKARAMDKYKEFQGRDLDECIAQALKWFDVPRESLEIDILQDAKSGIFGIVGARKAKIRARRVYVAETVRSYLETSEKEESPLPQGKPENMQPVQPAHQDNALKRKKMRPKHEKAAQGKMSDFSGVEAESKIDSALNQECAKHVSGAIEEEAGVPSGTEKGIVAEHALEIVKKLLTPLADKEIIAHVSMDSGKPRVRVEWEGDAGLLIGREGQTLAAIQYIASRILSRTMDAPMNLQLDVGEYRTRQDDKLRILAASLAEKVRRTGRPLSTRPLSSYHRRVVHMCLQGEEDLQTRSTGDGPLKRVLISPRRN